MERERIGLGGRIVRRLEYAFANSLRISIGSLPERLGRATGRGLARLSGLFLGKRRRLAREQAEAALGPAGRAVARACLAQLGEMVVEIYRIPRDFNPSNWRARIDIEGEEHLRAAEAEGKGVLAVGSHLGNWMVGCAAMGYLGRKVTWLVRPLENPLMQRKLDGILSISGQKSVEKWGGLKGSVEALRRGEVLVVVADQDARKEGVFVPFFGRPASTVRAPAILSRRTGAPLLVFSCTRAPGGRFRLRFNPPFRVGEGEAGVAEATARFTAEIEAAIRTAPEQWLWIHRRWKTKPPAPAAPAAPPAGEPPR